MNQHKLITFFSVLFLAVIIGLVSWDSLQKDNNKPTGAIATLSGYYVGKNIPASMMPDDNVPLIIVQGRFKDGTLVDDGLAPLTIAQRQISLVIGLDAIPHDQAATISQILALIDRWKQQGTSIKSIYFDYRPKNPDFPAYSALIKAFKKKTVSDPYVLNVVADFSWLDKKPGTDMIGSDISSFMFELDSRTLPAGIEAKLKSFQWIFLLRLPAGETEGLPLPMDHYRGLLFTLMPDKPLRTQKPRVGIFPKL